jgi:hypothetical protein
MLPLQPQGQHLSPGHPVTGHTTSTPGEQTCTSKQGFDAPECASTHASAFQASLQSCMHVLGNWDWFGLYPTGPCVTHATTHLTSALNQCSCSPASWHTLSQRPASDGLQQGQGDRQAYLSQQLPAAGEAWCCCRLQAYSLNHQQANLEQGAVEAASKQANWEPGEQQQQQANMMVLTSAGVIASTVAVASIWYGAVSKLHPSKFRVYQRFWSCRASAVDDAALARTLPAAAYCISTPQTPQGSGSPPVWRLVQLLLAQAADCHVALSQLLRTPYQDLQATRKMRVYRAERINVKSTTICDT